MSLRAVQVAKLMTNTTP